MMRHLCFHLTVLMACIASGVLAPRAWAADRPSLVPPPQDVRWEGAGRIECPADGVAIVLGEKPAPPERAAADLFARCVERRYGRKWPIYQQGQGEIRAPVQIVLGQPATHSAINSAAADLPAVPDAVSTDDGYRIAAIARGDRKFVLVAGSNARGVLYGQDTLFQLLDERDGKLWLHTPTIRDWPTVPWRGRPQTNVYMHLREGIMDLYAMSRVNFIDLRNGTYAFEPDYAFTDKDKKEIAETIKLSRERGIVVFGSVNCGVSSGQYDAVMDKFREFIAMGVDGLWLSFDDKGPGSAPEQITYDVLELGLQHGIKGDRIAITPPKGSYQTIDVPFDRKIMAVPGMERALWFWTPLPSPVEAERARAIGAEVLPSWWHNWPRPRSTFTYVRGSLCTEGRRSYLEVPAMAEGWHRPTYEYLAANGQYVETVMPWGGNEWHQHYVTPVICWWGWNPAGHDWSATRGRIYDTVYGPSQVETLRRFDDKLVELRSLFAFANRSSDVSINPSARLRRLEDRDKALKMVEQLAGWQASVACDGAKGSLIDAADVQRVLIDAMGTEVQAARAAATLDFPEYWWDGHQRQVLQAVHTGDFARADELIAQVKPRVEKEAKAAGEQLAFLRTTTPYVAQWQRRASMSARDWQAHLQGRQEELPRRVWYIGYYSVVVSTLLEGIHNVPIMWGRGGAERQMLPVATVLPEPQEQYRGNWMAGVYRTNGVEAAVFALDPNATSEAGDYAELPVTIPVKGAPRDRLGVLLFMNRWTKDMLGLELAEGRWMDYAKVQLLWDDRVLWEGDVGLPRKGHEWELVRLPTVPQGVSTVTLRLRVIDLKNSDGMRAIVFVSPLHVVELPED